MLLYSAFALLLVAATGKGAVDIPEACSDFVYPVEEPASMAGILQETAANNTLWVNVCLDNGLMDLSSCMFPPVGTELLISCNSTLLADPAAAYLTYATELRNITTREAVMETIYALLEQHFEQSIISAEEALENAELWADFVEVVFGPDYELRQGACGPNSFGTVPSWLVGQRINQCCIDHDRCFDDCKGFNHCNDVFAGCVDAGCNSWRWSWQRSLCRSLLAPVMKSAVRSFASKAIYCTNNSVGNNPFKCFGGDTNGGNSCL